MLQLVVTETRQFVVLEQAALVKHLFFLGGLQAMVKPELSIVACPIVHEYLDSSQSLRRHRLVSREAPAIVSSCVGGGQPVAVAPTVSAVGAGISASLAHHYLSVLETVKPIVDDIDIGVPAEKIGKNVKECPDDDSLSDNSSDISEIMGPLIFIPEKKKKKASGPAPAPASPPAPPSAAAPAPAPPLPLGLGPIEKFKWGQFEFAELRPEGIRVGWGVTCGAHKDAGRPAVCKKTCRYQGHSDAETILALKRWVLLGMQVPSDAPDGKQKHFSIGSPLHLGPVVGEDAVAPVCPP